jgi:pyruvate,water dikinase
LVDERRTVGSYLRAAFDALRGRGASKRAARRTARFALMYERFREILTLNNSALETYADLEDRLSGRKSAALRSAARSVRRTALDVFVMVKDLNLISGGRDRELYAALDRLNVAIEAELSPHPEGAGGPLTLRLDDLRAPHAHAAGSKMANLGEARAACAVAVPAGFVVTTEAFSRFMAENDLWTRCDRLESILETDGHGALGAACREIERAILDAAIPAELADAIHAAYRAELPGAPLVAMRSSAVGEDDPHASHAGLYLSRLNVREGDLLDAYRSVVASAFGPGAVAYRREHGLSGESIAMAVGCVQMIDPLQSGIIFSRLPEDESADAVLIGAIAGLSDGVTAGRQAAETLTAQLDRLGEVRSALLDRAALEQLADAARRLERHFGAPQDIEWAFDRAGQLHILQARPMSARAPRIAAELPLPGEAAVLLAGGLTACPGVGAGPVFQVNTDGDIDAFPRGAVLVTRHSSPKFSRVMRRCAAIVSNVGSPTGHMSILAREFGVPTIVGMEGATDALEPGRLVTVDAASCRVFDRALAPPRAAPARPLPRDSAALRSLERVAQLVTPLHLIDPASADFSPEGCRSLHDITRYVHERVFETMFHYADLVDVDHQSAVKLRARLPIDVLVFDVGGGVSGAASSSSLDPADITSVPMRAFLEGLLDGRIRWDQPRPVSMRGFLSVLGENIAAPPAEAQQLGRASYAIVSDSYLNFSTKAGYHFSTLDAFCEASRNKNYVHFRFAGGAADETRRARRVRFVSSVLAALNFKVNARDDLLGARLDKIEPDVVRARLTDLGRLTLCVRQMDMLMSSDAVADQYAAAFLAGEWHKF